MRCITIQNKNVYDTLMKTGIYRSNGERVAENLVRAYKFAVKHFGWKSWPIFLNPVGYRVEFAGANLENAVAIELDVPDELLKIQEYYSWTDFIYFLEEDDEEFRDGFEVHYETPYDYGKVIIDTGIIEGHYGPFQCMTELIRKEWVVNKITNLEKLKEEHYQSGGDSILHELSYYE